MNKFNARAYERELVAAGYMPASEYVRRWGEKWDAKEEALSSRAEAKLIISERILAGNFFPRNSANITKSKANTGSRADD